MTLEHRTSNKHQGDAKITSSQHRTAAIVDAPSPNVPSQYCLNKECIWLAGQLLDRMDESVDPCTDFEKFSCGSFLSRQKASDYDDDIDSKLEVRVRKELEKEWFEYLVLRLACITVFKIFEFLLLC